MDEDDLRALRSAALASRSAKLEPGNVPGDEDLDALRKAALMTRKQNQIQVIQRKNETPQMPAAPVRLPMHLLPQMKNIPPPPLLVPPPPLHSLAIPPPSIFSRPLIVRPPVSAWATNNLISLTPGYRPMTASRQAPPFLRAGTLPLMSVRAPFRGQTRKMPLRYTFPIKANPVKAPSLKVINPTESAEQKVSDKFSRYESKSSSEDEDETSATKKKDGDVSDAESVVSQKSLSGESDADNEPDASTAASEEKQTDERPDTKSEDTSNTESREIAQDERCDDDISIIGDGEDDDILAAIDDFLEDRPEKVEPKTAVKDSVVRETPLVKKETSTAKKETPKVRKTPITFETSESKIRSEDKRTSRDESVSKSSDANLRANVKKTSFQSKSRKDFPMSTDNVPKVVHEKNRPGDRQMPRSGVSSRMQAMSQDVHPERTWHIPVAANLKVPSPLRQRKDSDLDSVGTSDLSFLSSDEGTKEAEQTKPQRKRPRTRSISDEMEKRRNERLSKKSRLLDVKAEKLPGKQSPERRPAENRRGHDLRKKLESKGLKRPKVETAAPVADSGRDAISRPDKIDIKRGIISLKARESRFGSAKSKNAGDDARIRITASVNSGTRAVRRGSNGSQAKNAPSSENTPRREKVTILPLKQSFKPSPVVPPMDTSRTVKQPPKKTARRGSDERVLLRKSIDERSPKKDAVAKKESSESSSEGEIFHEEQVFSFADQDVADYDDVLGDITEDVELTPKVRRRSSGRGIGIGKGIESRPLEDNRAGKTRTDSIRAEKPEKRELKDKEKKKIPVHQRLGKQLQYDEESSPRRKYHSLEDDDVYVVQRSEPDIRVHSGIERRILVTKTPSPPPHADEFTSKERKFQSRHGSSVETVPKVKSVASTVPNSKSRRVTEVKRTSKNHQPSPDRESVLERKIRRIKQQNGKILRRQMEIQKEKEQFG